MTAGCVIRADSNADSNPSRHEGHDLDHLAQPYAQAGWWRMSSGLCPDLRIRRLGVRIPPGALCDVPRHRWQVSRDIVAVLGGSGMPALHCVAVLAGVKAGPWGGRPS